MKLAFKRLELRLAHTWAIARTSATSSTTVVVLELTAADGTKGIGEAAPISRYKESVKTVEAFLARVDPRGLSFADIEGSMQYLETLSQGDTSAKCALNLALLDGQAKRARQPVYDLLGLGFQEGKHVTSFTIGIASPEEIRQKVLEAAEFPVLKLKLGVASDSENLSALRAVAPTKTIRVDANEGWKTKEEALSKIEALAADPHVEFVEQPMPAATPTRDWVWLKQRSPLPIFADESYHHAADAEVSSECFHGVNVKLVKTGGITGAHQALLAARKLGLKTMLGCMLETSVLISAAAQLAELCDYLDLDGNLLVKDDPYIGVTQDRGVLGFGGTPEAYGLRVAPRA